MSILYCPAYFLLHGRVDRNLFLKSDPFLTAVAPGKGPTNSVSGLFHHAIMESPGNLCHVSLTKYRTLVPIKSFPQRRRGRSYASRHLHRYYSEHSQRGWLPYCHHFSCGIYIIVETAATSILFAALVNQGLPRLLGLHLRVKCCYLDTS